MNRRHFLTSSLAAGVGAIGARAGAQTTDKPMPEFYELRQYHLRVTMRQRFSDHLKDEALPAFGRAGVGPIGVFTVAFGPDSPTFWMLIPHKTLDSVVALDRALQADAQYKTPFLKLPSTDPGYVRIDSQLMVVVTGRP